MYEQIFSELVSNLKSRHMDFKGCYLFGSRAKGNNYEESDFEIVALFDAMNREKKFDLYEIVSNLEYKYNIFIDIKFLTDADLKANPFFYNEVVNYGKFYG
jgi:predicted nucleotidyltransferase